MGRAQGQSHGGRAARRNSAGAVASSRASAERAWRDGHGALLRGDTAAAAERFGAALKHDPDCADALLGLHSAGVAVPGHLKRLLACVEHLGELQGRLHRPLRSSSAPVGFQRHQIEDRDDILRARAGELIAGGELVPALLTLGRADPEHPVTVALKAKVALRNENFELCVRLAQTVRENASTGADANLLLGQAYTQMGLHPQALRAFADAERQAEGAPGAMRARYERALTYEHAGAADLARAELAALYHDDHDYLDVAVRLRQAVTEPPAEPSGGEQTSDASDAWEGLASELQHGAPAEDPSIHDNQ